MKSFLKIVLHTCEIASWLVGQMAKKYGQPQAHKKVNLDNFFYIF